MFTIEFRSAALRLALLGLLASCGVSDIGNMDFFPYSISGTISGAPAGVTITATHPDWFTGSTASDSVTTDANGHYSFGSVTGGATYTLTPTSVDYLFSPSKRTVTVGRANVTGQDFSVIRR